jgi:hypothetical protein
LWGENSQVAAPKQAVGAAEVVDDEEEREMAALRARMAKINGD